MAYNAIGWAGGQNQNKVSSGVRAIHRPSGAVGEARDTRSQLLNRRAAFRRMAESREFQRWLKTEVARHTGELDAIERRVDAAMHESNLKIEVFWGAEIDSGNSSDCCNYSHNRSASDSR